MMNYIFFGTPRFAEIILAKLIDSGMPPALVVCNPDKPVGRKHVLTAPAVKSRIMNYELRIKNKIKIWQPEILEIGNWKLEIDKLGSIDAVVVAAYNKIIPKTIIDTLPAKFIGIHPSLLPKYRGPSPIQQAILDGEKETGVTLYLIDEKVDHGPILVQRELNYELRIMNYKSAEQKLAELGAELLIEILPKYINREINLKPQDETQATFTRKFVTDDGLVDPVELAEARHGASLTKAELIARKIRALNPEPGVYIIQNGKRLKLLEVRMIDNKWIVTKTQLEGKRPREDKIVLG